MYDLTCSFHKGTCASSHLGHNRRTIFVPHSDPTRSHLNICYKDMTVEEAYHLLFDNALEEYNKEKKTHLSKEEYILHQEQAKSKINAELVEQEAGELLQEQDNFIDFVQNSDKAIAYLEHIENQELRKTVSEYEVVKQRNEKILSESWLEFNSSTSAYFEQYRRKKKMLFEEIKRARQDSYYSRKRLKSILYDIAHNNDFFIVKMFKLVVALFIAVESQSLENEVKKLQKKNQEIKLQAKQIMSDSQSVGKQLRSGDVDMIEQVLKEYENQLQKSIEKINEINAEKVKLPDNYTEQER